MRDRGSESGLVPSRVGSVPLLSIIIPVYNLESYIALCLDAIAGQAFQDVEMIAVDGGSTDCSRELLEKRMTDEPRLSVVWADRIGPGKARNAGARMANGEYLWFVDGDDQIAPGCLTPISERLLAERPDVLVINHAVMRPDETLEPGQDDRVVRQEDGQPFTLAQRPWLVELGLVSWNKIVRREFFQSAGLEFAGSWPHEDVPVSCELLLTAHRLSVLNHVCYYYRRHRPGSATSAGSQARHFAVFDSWPPVLTRNREKMRAESGDPQVTREVYQRLFHRSVWHCSTILDTAGYVARSDRRAFFGRISELYAEYVPPGSRLPDGFRGMKFWLIARGFYGWYTVLDPLNRVRLAAQRVLTRPQI